MDDIKLLITAGLNPGSSANEINQNIKQLQKVVNRQRLNLKINIDQNVLKQIEQFNTRMKALGDQALNTGRVVERALLPSGTRVEREYFNGINNEFREIVKNAENSARSMEKASGATKQVTQETKLLAEEQERAKKQRERALQYEQRTRRAIDSQSQQDREKALQYEQRARSSVEQNIRREKEKTSELQRQVSLYQRQAQLNAQNIRRTHGTTVDDTALRSYLTQVNALNSATPNLNNRMQELSMQFRQVSGNAKEAAGSMQHSGMAVTEMMRTALVNNFAVLYRNV